jgi:uroporphyrin-3 C-methyltransferase
MTENDKDKSNLPIAADEQEGIRTESGESSPETDSTQNGDEPLTGSDALESEAQGHEAAASNEEPVTEQEDLVQTEPVVKSNKSWLLLFFATFAVLIAVVAGGYWVWYQLQQQVATLQTSQQTLAEELQASRSQLARLENLNQNTNSDWQEAVQALESLLVQSAQRLNAQANRTENRWPLEEALTLTRLANQRLQLDASAVVAVGLLKSADAILSEQDQAAVLPIRRQLAADILSLQSTPAADVNGLFFQLDAVAGEIKEWVWVPKPLTQTAIPENTDPVSGFWQSLKQVVVVTRLDVPMQAPPLQSDFERWRQHTLLLLEQTQLALLARNQSLFDTALRQTQDQLSQMVSQFEMKALQQSLAEMEIAQLNPDWPDVNASIVALEVYLAEQANQQASDEEESTEDSE